MAAEVVAEVADPIPEGDPFQVLLFQLPKDKERHGDLQDKFLTSREFWQPYLAKLFMWTKPLAVTKTETPDGSPALALLLSFTDFEDILFQVGQDVAEALECPAFAVTLTFLDEAGKEELLESFQPW